jgi:pimeloyl-ACP methyl ester carboxylesterase
LNEVPKSKEVLLITHGYLGSNIAFFKMYKELMKHFHIISFDFPGHGLSSSDPQTPESIDTWIEYFVSDINKMVEKLGISKFHILGHSLGCFIMTHYANRYPQKVKKMFLLSPGGVNRYNAPFIKNFEKMIQKYCLVNFVAKKIFNKIFIQKKSPMDFFIIRSLRGVIAHVVYKGKRLKLTREEQDLFVPLYQNIYYSNPSSEKCAGYIFDRGPTSERPLMPIFEKFHKSKDIHIFYGETDMMDHKLTASTIKEKELNISVDYIKESGHQIMFQNPKEAVRMILQQYHKQKESPKE